MTQTFLPFLTQLTLSIGWSLLHSIWQGGLIWMFLTVIFRAFPAMSARLKHGCALMALLILGCWVANTALTQWDQLQNTIVGVASGNGSTGYTIEVPPQRVGFAQVPESAWNIISSGMPWLMFGYGLGLLIMSVRFGKSLFQLNGLRRRHSILPEEQMLQLLETLKLQMGITQKVALRLSAYIAVPMVIGVLRPLILLPVSMLETLKPGELEAILLHELAHVSRADFLVNVLLSGYETLFFFNPFVWWISANIHRDREHCCDDLVVAYTGQPLTYARVLASLAECQPSYSMAVVATGRPKHLLNRIKRIIEMKSHPLRYGQIITACSLAAILLSAAIVCFTPSFAQQSKKNANNKATGEVTIETRKNSSIVYTDSNGSHEYESFDAIPALQQEQIRAVFASGLKQVKDHGKQLENIRASLVSMYDINVDSITEPAFKSAEIALKEIDWNAIGDQVDSAMKQVTTVDWQAMRREVMAGLSEARIRMADTQWRAQLRRETARAGREIVLATRSIKRESQRSAEQAARDLETAERRMEEARQQMIQAKAGLKRLRHESSGTAKGSDNSEPPAPPSSTAVPAPPAPPSANDIPAAPAPPALSPIPSMPPAAPSAAPPAAPSAGHNRK